MKKHLPLLLLLFTLLGCGNSRIVSTECGNIIPITDGAAIPMANKKGNNIEDFPIVFAVKKEGFLLQSDDKSVKNCSLEIVYDTDTVRVEFANIANIDGRPSFYAGYFHLPIMEDLSKVHSLTLYYLPEDGLKDNSDYFFTFTEKEFRKYFRDSLDNYLKANGIRQ